MPAARRVLRERGAEAVLGGGGYVAGPAGLAALRLRLPLVLTEADRHLGLTNRLLARRARRVCLAFPIEGLDDERYLVTGRPVPAAILAADRGARPRTVRDRRRRSLPARLRRQPGRALDQPRRGRGLRRRGRRRRDFHVLHISGSRDHAELRAALAAAAHPDRYTLLEYEPTLADALAACDLVLARSGGSIFEIAAAARPSILVPYPYASARHQHANAEWMAAGGAAVVIEDSELEPRAAARSGRRSCSRTQRGSRRWPRPPPRSRAPTPPSGSRPSCSARSATLCRDEQLRLERARAALHRHRRRRDERPGARLPRARRPGDRLRSRRELVPAAAAGGRARAAGRPRRRPGARGRRGGRLDRDRRGQPGAGPRARARPAGHPSRRAAGRALLADGA